jgi:hypothetical protein
MFHIGLLSLLIGKIVFIVKSFVFKAGKADFYKFVGDGNKGKERFFSFLSKTLVKKAAPFIES